MSYGAIFGKTGKFGFYPTLTITPVGAVLTSVTATSSTGQVYNATQQDSQWFVQVNDFDTYTVTGNYTGGSVSQDVDVVVNQNYDVTLTVISNTLNDNSWATIRSVADAGTGANYWSVGDAKQITLNGTVGILTLNNYQPYVYIIGFNHNADLEGSNRIHFLLGKTRASGGKDICLVDEQYLDAGYSAAFRMNTGNNLNSGGWKDSFMRNNICGISKENIDSTIMGTIPAELRNALKNVTKYTNNTGYGSSSMAVTATTDYFFLLAEYEVFGTIIYGNAYEANYQQQYDYYAAGNSKIKYQYYQTGTAAFWWLRSPHARSAYSFMTMNTNGTVYYYGANYSLGFAPAFCV